MTGLHVACVCMWRRQLARQLANRLLCAELRQTVQAAHRPASAAICRSLANNKPHARGRTCTRHAHRLGAASKMHLIMDVIATDLSAVTIFGHCPLTFVSGLVLRSRRPPPPNIARLERVLSSQY